MEQCKADKAAAVKRSHAKAATAERFRPATANFAGPADALDYMQQQRGYRITQNNNWLPPNSIAAPSKLDLEAALFLSMQSNYGGIVKLRPCPFCGGRGDPYSPIGVECADCGGAAPDLEIWQKRIG